MGSLEFYIFHPDGSNRPEIWVPGVGYLFFGLPYEGNDDRHANVRLCEAGYVKNGARPGNTEFDMNQYVKFEPPNWRPLMVALDVARKISEMRKRGDKSMLEFLYGELDTVLPELREMTGTVGRY